MDTVNQSAGLIMSYHMLDAVVRGMFAPPDEVAFPNTNTNTLNIQDNLHDPLLAARPGL